MKISPAITDVGVKIGKRNEQFGKHQSKKGGSFAFLSLEATPRLNDPINSNLQCCWNTDLAPTAPTPGLGVAHENIRSYSTPVQPQTEGSAWDSGTASYRHSDTAVPS